MKLSKIDTTIRGPDVVDLYTRIENRIIIAEAAETSATDTSETGSSKGRPQTRFTYHQANLSQLRPNMPNFKKSSRVTTSSALQQAQPVHWPKAVPFAKHNVYWVRQTASPCVCLGLDLERSFKNSGPLVRIVSINSSSYRHEVSVPAATLEAFNPYQAPNNADDAFALAMIDFFQWEESKQVRGWEEMVWYHYPDFIYRFFQHPPTWATFRKQAERAARGRNEDRRDSYLAALVAEMANRPTSDLMNRITLGKRLPWNDDLLCSDEETSEGENSVEASDVTGVESMSEEEDQSNETKKASGKKAPKSSSKRSQPSPVIAEAEEEGDEDADLLSETEEETIPREMRPGIPWSAYNLYWLPRASLPCLFRDKPENMRADTFVVQPVCCVTYHYPVKSANRQMEPLTMQLLKQCTDERTQDFTTALIDFAQWQISQAAQKESMAQDSLNVQNPEYSQMQQQLLRGLLTNEAQSYLWPETVFNLISKPSQWASWRKAAERKLSAGQPSRKQCYLTALMEIYEIDVSEATTVEQEASQNVPLVDDKDASMEGQEKGAIQDQSPGSGHKPDKYLSPFSLYWINTSALPCLQIDFVANELNPIENKHVLQPICCETYHYPVNVLTRQLEPLTLNLLRMTADERTQDFTLALIDFAEWKRRQGDAGITLQNSVSSGVNVTIRAAGPHTPASKKESSEAVRDHFADRGFVWPSFIVGLIRKPRDWSAWRKTSERKYRQAPRKTAYLSSLIEDYRASADLQSSVMSDGYENK
jgi:hypothetical protein